MADETMPGGSGIADFVHEWPRQRVRFAHHGAASAVAAEAAALGARRIMAISSPGQAALAERVSREVAVAGHYHDVTMHVPLAVAERGRQAAADAAADALLCVGGGSTTGLAKAIALTTGLPIIAVPTTYAGSEATHVWGITEGRRKTTGKDPRVLPRAVVYDASLTVTLPVPMSVASGLNALAHCVDSLWAPQSDPINRVIALAGLRAAAGGIRAVHDDAKATAGRQRLLFGAYLSARAFASAGSGLHHKICHVLGGMFNLPHAQTHAVMLPYTLGFNGPSAPDAAHEIASALDADDALQGLLELYRRTHAPRALRDYGVSAAELHEAIDAIVAAAPDDNPTTVTPESVGDLLDAAWEGRLLP